jgi:flagellar basal-body rod modification protein FlgD
MTTATTSATGGSTATQTSGASGSNRQDNRSQIAGNFDQFLAILTTQLKNQSPLEPLDTNQFTQQLVQFAQVEQQLKQNETLASLLSMNKATTATSAMSFVGARVTINGETSSLKDGKAEWRINAPRGGTATVTVKDKGGNVVATENITLNAGDQTYSWNGQRTTGGTASDGEYSIVIDAVDAQRQKIDVKTEVTAVVDGVDFTGDQPVLIMGSRRSTLDQVKSVTRS